MRTRITSLVLGAMLAAIVAASPVAAGSRLVITLDVVFGVGEHFTAQGAFCPSGSAVSDTWVSGHIPGRLQFHVDKVLTCDDGSGDLWLSLTATQTFTGTTGGWKIVGGTGAYAGASGGGQVTGVGSQIGIVDTYRGSINN